MTNRVPVTITVPAELMLRMDAADDINWSLVASELFQAFLDDLQVVSPSINMD